MSTIYNQTWFNQNKTRKILIFDESVESMVAAAKGDTSKEPHARIYGDGVETDADGFSLCSDPWNGTSNLPYPFNNVGQLYTRYKIKYSAIKNHYDFGTGNLIIIIKS